MTRSIAFEVGKAAQQSGVAAEMSDDMLLQSIQDNFGYRITVLINAGQFSRCYE